METGGVVFNLNSELVWGGEGPRSGCASLQRGCEGRAGGQGVGGLRGVSHPFGPASVEGGGGGSKRYAALFVGPQKGTSPRPAPSLCGG